ncbi:MAG: hypothetical protein FWG25_00390 [Promicromonosporaceae bacterium]|nr:hypothetical protein [Promicromonosporaceae bacterium]
MATAITIGTRTFVLADSVDEVELMLELSSARPSEWVGIESTNGHVSVLNPKASTILLFDVT